MNVAISQNLKDSDQIKIKITKYFVCPVVQRVMGRGIDLEGK